LYNKTKNHYYSFNIDNVHFISINFDLVINYPDLMPIFLSWMEQDLISANEDRQLRPWIIVYTHRPLYCSDPDETDCSQNHIRFHAVDDLLFEYKVDLYVSGHVHTYERMFPIYNGTVYPFENIPIDPDNNYMINAQATIHIVQGRAGQKNDGTEKGTYPPSNWSCYISADYSFMGFHAFNETHMLMENVISDSGLIDDYLWIIKDPNYGKPNTSIYFVQKLIDTTSSFKFEILLGFGAILVLGAVVILKKKKQGYELTKTVIADETISSGQPELAC